MKDSCIFRVETSAAAIVELVDRCIWDKFWDDVMAFNEDMTDWEDDREKKRFVNLPLNIHRNGITAAAGAIIDADDECEDGLDIRTIKLAGHLLNQLADTYIHANPKYTKVKLTHLDNEPQYVSTTMFAHALKSAGNYMVNMIDDELNLILTDRED